MQRPMTKIDQLAEYVANGIEVDDVAPLIGEGVSMVRLLWRKILDDVGSQAR